MRINNNLVKIIKIFLSALFLIIIIYNIKPENILEAFKSVKFIYLIPIIFIEVLIQIFNTANILVLSRVDTVKLTFNQLFLVVPKSWAIGTILPGKIGESSIVLFLKKHGVNYPKGLAYYLVDKLISIFFIFSLFLLLSFFILKQDLNLIILAVLIVLSIFFSLMSKKIFGFFTKKIFKNNNSSINEFLNCLSSFYIKGKKIMLYNLIFTCIKWFLSFFAYWFIFLSLELNVSLIAIAFVSSVTILVSLIPISISGLGLREGTGSLLYISLFNIGPSIAATAMFIGTIRMYLVAFLIYVIITLIENKSSLKHE